MDRRTSRGGETGDGGAPAGDGRRVVGRTAGGREIVPTRTGADLSQRLGAFSRAALESVRTITSRGSHGIHVVIVPQDLRTTDPSLAAEMALGTLGLAGAYAEIGDDSPFAVAPPTDLWDEALHSFAWLADLRAANVAQAQEPRERARALAADWMQRHGGASGNLSGPWRPGVAARRTLSWLTNSGFLLEDSEPRTYDQVVTQILTHARVLASASIDEPHSRLMARTAVVLTGLCLSEQERTVTAELPRLLDEIDAQVLPDGGHITRHPGATVDILLDLLPLRTCFAARGMPVPPRFEAAIERMLPMLRFVRLGDGSIVRFNGMSGTPPDKLAAVLAYDDRRAVQLEAAPQSRFVRLQRRQSVVVLEAGGPPALEFSGEAHAGCLAFEMSAGRFPVIVGCGAPGPADQDWRIQARATASHSTLVLGEQSSGTLVRSGPVFEKLGVPLITGPARVESGMTVGDDGSAEFRGSHDGYAERFETRVLRILRLTPQGDRLDGLERLLRPVRPRLPRLQYAIHFHTHPSARVVLSHDGDGGEITLPNGECWRLTAPAANLALEESIYLAHVSGPMRSIQIVLRGVASGDTDVAWKLERVQAGNQRYRHNDPARTPSGGSTPS